MKGLREEPTGYGVLSWHSLYGARDNERESTGEKGRGNEHNAQDTNETAIIFFHGKRARARGQEGLGPDDHV